MEIPHAGSLRCPHCKKLLAIGTHKAGSRIPMPGVRASLGFGAPPNGRGNANHPLYRFHKGEDRQRDPSRANTR